MDNLCGLKNKLFSRPWNGSAEQCKVAALKLSQPACLSFGIFKRISQRSQKFLLTTLTESANLHTIF
jgi:hypothetical protein